MLSSMAFKSNPIMKKITTIKALSDVTVACRFTVSS